MRRINNAAAESIFVLLISSNGAEWGPHSADNGFIMAGHFQHSTDAHDGFAPATETLDLVISPFGRCCHLRIVLGKLHLQSHRLTILIMNHIAMRVQAELGNFKIP